MRLILKPHERRMIIKAREEEAKQIADTRFQIKVIKTAAKAWQWSIKNNEGLSFSTFVNNFGYQDKDASKMYEAVIKLIEFATISFEQTTKPGSNP